MSDALPGLQLTQDHVDRAYCAVDAPLHDPRWQPLTDDDLDGLATALTRGRPRPVPIFAYGSLIWNPGFPVQARRKATAVGWQRAFSITLDHFRGSPERPGLMLALERAGRCEGLILEIEEGTEAESLRTILRRELVTRELQANACWIDVETERGTEQALTFYAPPVGAPLAGLGIEDQAERLARANGPAGSGADYLLRTAEALRANDLSDPYIDRLQRLVAEVIDRDCPPGRG